MRGAGIPPAAARQHQEVPDWPRQQTGTGLRDAQIAIWIRITGRMDEESETLVLPKL